MLIPISFTNYLSMCVFNAQHILICLSCSLGNCIVHCRDCYVHLCKKLQINMRTLHSVYFVVLLSQVFIMLTFLSLLKAKFGCGLWRTFRLYLLSTCDLFSLKYSPDISNFLCPMINSYSVTAFFNATKYLLNHFEFVIQ